MSPNIDKTKEHEIELLIKSIFVKYPVGAKSVLNAIWEVNIEQDKKSDNYLAVEVVAYNNGLKKDFEKILAELQLLGFIHRSPGAITIPEEIMVLYKHIVQSLIC